MKIKIKENSKSRPHWVESDSFIEEGILPRIPPSNYTHPSEHPASMITEDVNRNFINIIQKSYIHNPGSDNQDLSGLAPLVHSHNYEPVNANIQTHVTAVHAPAGAQVNADITKAEIEAKLTGPISSHSHSGGADPFIAKLVLGADKPTGANVTPVTLELSFNYEVNSKYIIDIYAIVAPTAATTGCGFMIDVSTAVTYVGLFVSHQLANTGTISGAGSIGDSGATAQGISSGMPNTSSNFVSGSGILITGANTGTATFFFRSETTAVTTCKANSIIRVMKV